MENAAAAKQWRGTAAVAAVLGLAVILPCHKIFNHDLFWHLAAGRWIAENRAVPLTDPFSFSRAGLEWIDAQWLFQAALWAFYRVFGEAGCTLLPLVFTVAMAGIFLALPAGRLPREMAAPAVLLFLLALNPRLTCRPEVMSYLLMAALLFALESARAGRRAWLAAAVFIQLLFVNTEGLWPLGLGLMSAYAADALIKSWRLRPADAGRAVGAWLAAAAVMAGLSWAQPYGTRGALFPLTLLAEVVSPSTPHKNLVEEFQPLFSPRGQPAAAFLFYLILAAAAAGSVLTGIGRARPALALLALISIVMALSARRNTGFSAVILTQVLLLKLMALTEARPEVFRGKSARGRGAAIAIIPAVFLAVLSLVLPQRDWDYTGRRPGLGIDWNSFPVEASAYLKSIHYRGNIINSENLGGYLIWDLWPACQVFADSRMELGGGEAIERYLQVFNDRKVLNEVARDNGADALITTWRAPYTDFLKGMIADPGWAMVHLDHNAAVFLRRTPGLASVIYRDEIKDPLQHEITLP